METTKIAELAKILKDNGLTKLDLTEGDNRLVLEAVSAPVAPAVVVPASVPAPAVQPADRYKRYCRFHHSRRSDHRFRPGGTAGFRFRRTDIAEPTGCPAPPAAAGFLPRCRSFLRNYRCCFHSCCCCCRSCCHRRNRLCRQCSDPPPCTGCPGLQSFR